MFAEMCEKGATIVRELLSEDGTHRVVGDELEHRVAKLHVGVAQERRGQAVVRLVEGVERAGWEVRWIETNGRILEVVLDMHASVRSENDFRRDFVVVWVCGSWVVPRRERAMHVAFELSGLSECEDHCAPLFVDEAFDGERVE